MKKIICFAVLMLLIGYAQKSSAQDSLKVIQAETYNETNTATQTKADKGIVVNKFAKGAWIKFNEVDFGKGATKMLFRASSGATTGKLLLEVRLAEPDGKLLAMLTVQKNGWGTFQEQELEIKKTRGKQKLVLVAQDGAVMLNWFKVVE